MVNIRHHLKCLRTMRRKFRSHPTPHMKTSIDASENSLQQKMVQARANFENNLLESGCTKDIYSYIHSISGDCALPPSIYIGQ